MSKLSSLRVHIAPVGFEIDRVVIPARQMKADKVWLLVHEKPSEDKATQYTEKIQKQLEKDKIVVKREMHDRLDLFKIIRSVRRIIEDEAGNSVYVNLASGSKIQAIASMMACMMFNEQSNVTPFYAEAERYQGFEGKQLSYGIKNLMQIPAYHIHTPRPELVAALRLINEHGGRLTKKRMAEIAEKSRLISVNAKEENMTQARFASLDKNIIQPLESQWGFIRTEKVGRNRWVQITQDGANASEFLI